METFYLRLKNSTFIKDNFVLFICTLILNLFSFVYHFYLGRALGPADYGILGVSLSLAYFFGLLLNSFQTSIANFVSKFKINNDYGSIAYLMRGYLKKAFLFSLIGLVIFLFLIKPISLFLKISTMPLFVLSFVLPASIFLPLPRGVLQGLQRFKMLGLNLVLEGTLKILFAFVLVTIGFGVNGALFAFVLAWFIPFFVGAFPLFKKYKKSIKGFETKDIFIYSFPVLIMLFSLTLVYTIDLFMVKHFFDDMIAGYYAALSMMGRILFFGSIPITQVMFPKLIELKSKNKKTGSLLYKSFGLLLLFIIPLILFYYFFPSIIVGTLYGSKYLEISPLLWRFGLFIGIFCLVYLLAFYNIALYRKWFVLLIFVTNIFEAILIYFYHHNIIQIINLLIIMALVTFLLLFIYTYLNDKKTAKVVNSNSRLQ